MALLRGDKCRALSRRVATGRALDKRCLLANLREMARDRVRRDIVFVANRCRDLLAVERSEERRVGKECCG